MYRVAGGTGSEVPRSLGGFLLGDVALPFSGRLRCRTGEGTGAGTGAGPRKVERVYLRKGMRVVC